MFLWQIFNNPRCYSLLFRTGKCKTHNKINTLPDRRNEFLCINSDYSENLSPSIHSPPLLVPRPGPKWRMRTANGESLASPIKLDSLSFGGLYMRDVQAVILAPEAGDVNLLGASFLKRLVSVEQRNGIMVLRQ